MDHSSVLSESAETAVRLVDPMGNFLVDSVLTWMDRLSACPCLDRILEFLALQPVLIRASAKCSHDPEEQLLWTSAEDDAEIDHGLHEVNQVIREQCRFSK